MKTKPLAALLGGLLLLLMLLAIPQILPEIKTDAARSPFVWDRDQLWEALETQFSEARRWSSGKLDRHIDRGLTRLEMLIGRLEGPSLAPDAALWGQAEERLWAVAPLIAARPKQFVRFNQNVNCLQRAAKRQARDWPPDQPAGRNRLYRLIYGGRTSSEEIALQAPDGTLPALFPGAAQPSATPGITVHGITVHSGDILVSRGGAPTSALIARGSDYPGNFSHVALAYVDARSGQGAVIEALIEKGVVITSVDDYLRDKKLRILVLRPRAELPAIRENPMAPHEAASRMFQRVQGRHIPYDFAMDFQNPDKMFCSEVVYAAYDRVGIRLWTGLSRISAPGTARWLAGFGVSHFITLEPSDLEYDPQLAVVAEWRDPEALFKDHLDNAVTDVMLEGANAGEKLQYNGYLLPLVRLAKLYSMFKNLWGAIGPVPEGMTATAALRHRWYSARHNLLVQRVRAAAEEFAMHNGYRPPYWELVKMARRARQSP